MSKIAVVKLMGSKVSVLTDKGWKEYKRLTIAAFGQIVNALKNEGYYVDLEVIR